MKRLRSNCRCDVSTLAESWKAMHSCAYMRPGATPAIRQVNAFAWFALVSTAPRWARPSPGPRRRGAGSGRRTRRQRYPPSRAVRRSSVRNFGGRGLPGSRIRSPRLHSSCRSASSWSTHRRGLPDKGLTAPASAEAPEPGADVRRGHSLLMSQADRDVRADHVPRDETSFPTTG